MHRRAYWLLPDLRSATTVSHHLVEAGVEPRWMHFMAREDCDMTGLQAASLLQTSDLLGSAEAGLAVGAGDI